MTAQATISMMGIVIAVDVASDATEVCVCKGFTGDGRPIKPENYKVYRNKKYAAQAKKSAPHFYLRWLAEYEGRHHYYLMQAYQVAYDPFL